MSNDARDGQHRAVLYICENRIPSVANRSRFGVDISPAVTAEIGITHVVGENQNDVGAIV